MATPESEVRERVSELMRESRRQIDFERGQRIVELVENLLMRRFTELNREEVRRMFQLHDLGESKVWQETHQDGREEGIEKVQDLKALEFVKRMQSKGMMLKQIAELLEIPLPEVRRLARAGK